MKANGAVTAASAPPSPGTLFRQAVACSILGRRPRRRPPQPRACGSTTMSGGRFARQRRARRHRRTRHLLCAGSLPTRHAPRRSTSCTSSRTSSSSGACLKPATSSRAVACRSIAIAPWREPRTQPPTRSSPADARRSRRAPSIDRWCRPRAPVEPWTLIPRPTRSISWDCCRMRPTPTSSIRSWRRRPAGTRTGSPTRSSKSGWTMTTSGRC